MTRSKNKLLKEKLLALGLSLSIIVVLDQWSKLWAIDTLRGRFPQSFLGDLFRLEYSENPGAFLGLGGNLPDWLRFGVLNIFVACVLLGSVVFLFRSRDVTRTQAWGLALLTSGGLSNLADRFFREGRHVIDFMNLGIGSLRTGIFNVADVAIMAGIFIFMLSSWRQEA